jgi:hypothetical protein
MSAIRYFIGWWIVYFAECLASFALRMCHAGAWCMDIDIDDSCAQCQAFEENNEPTDGPWFI